MDEIAAFARELRSRSVPLPLEPAVRAQEILDVCGTGGDRLETFNISTTVALVVAAGGVVMAKHGNRAITSRAGSADVLEALGVRTHLSPEEAACWLRDYRFGFLFAPLFHPAFRHISPARRLCAERGIRTVFNYLGPLLNPARPTGQLVGVPSPALCVPLAQVLQSLGLRRAMVVSGAVATVVDPPGAAATCSAATAPAPHLDELSTLGVTTIAEFYHDRGFHTSTLAPGDWPLQPVTLDDLRGGDAATNAGLVRGLLQGRDRGPRRDAVLLNAGAAFLVAGRVRSMIEGWALAGTLIDEGSAWRKVEELRQASERA